ncbi:glycosyltransferase [Chitinophaga sp. 30R24]|uniref:glycosyltransferase n=1 Tax=Chitinophaga sp. 30R24 TaxID=3248838 RepID=UPI003B8EDEEC
MKQPAKLLIFATMPPPIGGVTVHIQRLLQYLGNNSYHYTFIDFRRSRKGAVLVQLLKHRYIHFHIYHPVVRCLFVLIGTVLGKKMLFTLHGNLGRHHWWYNLLDQWAFRIAWMPIVLNQKSLDKGLRWNKRTRLIGAFIPPQNLEALAPVIHKAVLEMQAKHTRVFATNASAVSIDKTGKEIYQITLLVKIFQALPEAALIISDASGKYEVYLKEQGYTLTSNILLISEPHAFFEILKLSDIFLRITTTDGDSLSVKEALFLGKQVLATDVVNRPAGAQLVALNEWEIEAAVRKLQTGEKAYSPSHLTNGGEQLLALYKTMIA